MNKAIAYPAIFHKDKESGYWVSFPDLDGCVTQGETLEEAFARAKEALALFIDDMKTNLAGAARFGIKTFLFNDNTSELKDFILAL